MTPHFKMCYRSDVLKAVQFATILLLIASPGLGARRPCQTLVARSLNHLRGTFLGHQISKLAEPVIVSGDGGSLYSIGENRVETARIGSGPNPELNRLLELLRPFHGEVRLIESDRPSPMGADCYFRVTEEDLPIVGLERSAGTAIIAHETVHLVHWIERVKTALAEGSDHASAIIEASRVRLARAVELEEQKAVEAELANLQWTIFHPQWIARSVYPHLRGMRYAFQYESKKDEVLTPFAHRALETALLIFQQRNEARQNGRAPRRYVPFRETDCTEDKFYSAFRLSQGQMLSREQLRLAFPAFRSKCISTFR